MIGQNDGSATDKLHNAILKAKEMFGRDPRAGGFSFVGQFAVVQQVLTEIPLIQRELLPAIIVGNVDHGTGATSCTVFRFERVPLKVRELAKPGLHLLPDGEVPESTRVERFLAGKLRYAARDIRGAMA